MTSRAPVRIALTVSLASLFAIVSPPRSRAEDKAPTTYKCDGFDEPLKRPNIHIGRGRVLPLRGKLVGADGKFGDRTAIKTPPVVTLTFQPEGKPEVDKSGVLEVRDYGKGRSFVWDPEAHWKFDLGTKSLPDDGQYTVTLSSGDPKEYVVDPVCSLVFHLGGD